MENEVFLELHKDLPRQGPADIKSTRKAFSLLKSLSKEPKILDTGCGTGMQTIDLINLTSGTIVAVDIHQPFLENLKQKVKQKGFSARINVIHIPN